MCHLGAVVQYLCVLAAELHLPIGSELVSAQHIISNHGTHHHQVSLSCVEASGSCGKLCTDVKELYAVPPWLEHSIHTASCGVKEAAADQQGGSSIALTPLPLPLFLAKQLHVQSQLAATSPTEKTMPRGKHKFH